MHIYRIVNKINNKPYIGMTTELKVETRWSKYKNEKPSRPISHAIKKYGIDNFTFELLYTNFNLTEKELRVLETLYIRRYNSLVPDGYNIVESFDTWMREVSFREATVKYNQGLKKGNKNFVGVSKIESGFICNIRKGRTFSCCFPDEVSAAEGYDKMALYLYGDSATLNFPDKKEIYLNLDLIAVFNKFAFKNYSSKYTGVIFSSDKKMWRSVKYIDNKCVHLKYCSSEIEAAELYDQVSLYLNNNCSQINFPEKREKFLNSDLKKIYDSLAFNQQKSSRYPNVYYIKNRNRFKGEFIHNKKVVSCGRFKNEEEANSAVIKKKKEMGLL